MSLDMFKPDMNAMMKGSEGNLDYLIIARKEPFGIGVKAGLVAPGNDKNTIYIGARIRCARCDPESGSKKGDDPASMWPDITWEKTSRKRASAMIGMFMEGNMTDDAEETLKKMSGMDIPYQMTDYLFELVGKDHLTIDREMCASFIMESYDYWINSNLKMIKANKDVNDVISDTKGSFAMMGDLAKKALSKKTPEKGTKGEDPEPPEAV